MKKFRIVPDVIPRIPLEVAKVSFGSGVQADLGNMLMPNDVKDVPIVEWTADAEEYYTLCMVDPDAPERGKAKYREWQHWLVVNIPGSDVCSGDILTTFISSAPKKKTGIHRYVILIYQQPCMLTFSERHLDTSCICGRRNFHIARFARKYGLGEPVAGNFYRAEWDKYVPQILKNMNKKRV